MTNEENKQLPTLLADVIATSTSSDGYTEWYNRPEIQEAYRTLAKRYTVSLASLIVPNSWDKDNSRGIVIAGGGVKYFPSAYICIRRLRDLGCMLPIELWYLGDVEMDPTTLALLRPYGVRCIDALKVCQARILNGWELKPQAIIHSNFGEVLFLDADCVPVRNPEYLFNDPLYKGCGTVFWPDFPHWLLKPKVYNIFNCACPDNTVPPYGGDVAQFGKPINPRGGWDVAVESGQILVDKTRAFIPLLLTSHYCDHSDYYFRHVHGDKEAFHMAWRNLGFPYVMPQYWPGWDLHTALQYDFDGKLIFTHRNQDKWALGNKNKPGKDIPGEAECFSLLRELGLGWSGELWLNDTPNEAEQEVIKQLTSEPLLYYRKGFDVRKLKLNANGSIGEGTGKHEARWSYHKFAEDERLVLRGDEEITCFLRRGSTGSWCGNWLVHEKMPVALIPVSAVESKFLLETP